MTLSVQVLAICEINNTSGKYIFVRKYFQGTCFCELGLQNYKCHGSDGETDRGREGESYSGYVKRGKLSKSKRPIIVFVVFAFFI